MRTRGEVISRIKACLALADPAKNSNENERDTARRTAEKMMAEHGVSEAEVSGKALVDPADTYEMIMRAMAKALAKQGIKPKKRGWEGGL